MRLKRLWIDGFKNLNDFELDFSDKEGITVLIGNNGSGKSNVLEAISAIFTGLYKIGTPQRKPKFEYEIEYILNEAEYKLSLKQENEEYRYRFQKNEANILVRDMKINPQNYLPSQIITIYSGEEVRLWNEYYKHSHSDFMTIVKSNQLRTLPSYRLFYIDSDYWNEALLTLVFSDLNNNKKFISDYLDINIVNEIKFYFDIKKINNFPQNIIVDFIKKINPSNQNEKSFSLSNFKTLMSGEYEKDLFIKLISATLSGLITHIELIFNDNLTVVSLSEGEKKQILLRIALEVVADENSLILFDEPDANIHVANKGQIKEMLEEYSNRENILTTHSPTLTHAFDERHIVMLKDGKPENSAKQEIFSHITDGIWNYQEQNIFLSSSKDIILLVEGKHDKIHILEAFKRLKDNYEGLDFDIFDMNGEPNIKHMILGLANNNVDFNGKKIIAIFDNDKPGQKSFSENFRKIEDKQFKCLVDNSGNQSTIFYGLLLPKTNGFSSNFTIENMYAGTKFKEALATAFENRNRDNNFFNNFIDDVSKQIKEDAKNILANNCKDFDNNDFEHFKKLFDLIKDIELYDK